MSLVELRAATVADLPYIRVTWLKGWKPFSPIRQGSIYWSDFGQSGLVDHLLDEFGAIVAHPPGEPDLIAGWCCGEWPPRAPVVHYLHLNRDYSAPEFGVAAALLADISAPGVDLAATHLPQPGNSPVPFGLQAIFALGPKFVNPFIRYGRRHKHARS